MRTASAHSSLVKCSDIVVFPSLCCGRRYADRVMLICNIARSTIPMLPDPVTGLSRLHPQLPNKRQAFLLQSRMPPCKSCRVPFVVLCVCCAVFCCGSQHIVADFCLQLVTVARLHALFCVFCCYAPRGIASYLKLVILPYSKRKAITLCHKRNSQAKREREVYTALHHCSAYVPFA